jgi:hypothetical protein
MLFLLAMLISDFEPTWLKDLEIYMPITHRHAAVGPSGDLFIMDGENHRVKRYGPKGDLRIIGRRGQGPGEFEGSGSLQLMGDKLIVYTRGYASVFTLDGTFIHRVDNSNMTHRLQRVRDGWIRHNISIATDGPIQLEWLSEDHSKQKLLHTFDDDGLNREDLVGQIGKAIPYNPITNVPTARVSPDGRWVFMRMLDAFTILVFDMETKAVAARIEKDQAPVPFDKDWADQKLADLKKDPNIQYLRFTRDYPSYYPPIKGTAISPEGHLLVFAWTRRPNHPKVFAFNAAGEEVATIISSPQSAERVLGLRNGRALIAAFPDEEVAIAEVPVENIDEFIAKHPIRFDFNNYMESRR